jgi:amidase
MRYSEVTISRLFPFVILIILTFSCDSPSTTKSSNDLDIHDEITIDEIRNSYANDEYTIKELTQFYLDRIKLLSFNGPALNAVISINPDALDIAAQLDDEMQNGSIRGPLLVFLCYSRTISILGTKCLVQQVLEL